MRRRFYVTKEGGLGSGGVQATMVGRFIGWCPDRNVKRIARPRWARHCGASKRIGVQRTLRFGSLQLCWGFVIGITRSNARGWQQQLHRKR